MGRWRKAIRKGMLAFYEKGIEEFSKDGVERDMRDIRRRETFRKGKVFFWRKEEKKNRERG